MDDGRGLTSWQKFLRLPLWDRFDRLDARFGLPSQPKPRSRRAAWALASATGLLLALNAALDWSAVRASEGNVWLVAAAVLSTVAVPFFVISLVRSEGRVGARPPRPWVVAVLALYVLLQWRGGETSNLAVAGAVAAVVVVFALRRRVEAASDHP